MINFVMSEIISKYNSNLLLHKVLPKEINNKELIIYIIELCTLRN